MIEHVIDISEGPARLCVRNDLLLIERDGAEPATVPLAEISALVVSHPRVSFTQSVVSRLADAGGILVTCNERFLPAAMLLPLESHFTQTERFRLQVEAPLPTRKRLWQQIVRAKIAAQARLLRNLHGDDCGLAALVPRVRSGDATNVEAHASRHYWPLVFADAEFRRNPDGEGRNVLLNYGYAVLRAIVARAICAAGLHPSIGLHHKNRYNPFCLADDLMEPFRPVVDGAVARWSREFGPDAPLERNTKLALIEGLTGRFTVAGESRTLFDVLSRTVSSLVAVYAGQEKKLFLPEL